MLKFSWEMLFFESGETEGFKTDRNKLFASDKRQIDSQVDNQAAWHASLIYVSYVYLPL